MAEKKSTAKKLTITNTKQEMLNAYQELLSEMQEKSEAEHKPEAKIEEKARKEVIETADKYVDAGIESHISNLKLEINRTLSDLSRKLQDEADKYETLKKAVEAKEKELNEIYEIQKNASSLAALIEAQNLKKEEYENDLQEKRDTLEEEIRTKKADWEREKKQHEDEIKERNMLENKKLEREREEFLYNFNREKQLAKDKFEVEKAAMERELSNYKEETERSLEDRERAIADSEEELEDLRQRAAAFPQQLESSIDKAVKDATERIIMESGHREELLAKEFEGERNTLTARIETLQNMLKEQSGQIAKLTQQLEKSYGQVQDIAVKAVEGSSGQGTISGYQQLLSEQMRKMSGEK